MPRHRSPFAARIAIVLALAASLVTFLPGSTGAEPASKPRTAGMPVVDGFVNAAVQVGNTLYIGGGFTQIGISSGTFVTVSAVTGGLEPMAARYEGTIRDIVSDGVGGWYVAGRRISTDASISQALVHVLPDGSLDPAFAPLETNPTQINVLALHNGTLYVGGDFAELNGQPRGRLAAVDATTGALLPFDGELDGTVNAIEASATTLYIGGGFTQAKGTPRRSLAAYDIAAGTLTAWDPSMSGFGVARALQLVSTTLYVGGTFESIGGAPRLNLAALDTLTNTNNATPWDPQATSTVNALEVVGPTLVVGGVFDKLSGAIRLHLGAYAITTGTLLNWTPNPNHNVGALASNPGGTAVHVGGDFTMIGGIARSHLAEVEMALGTISPWNPGPMAAVNTIARYDMTVAFGGSFSGLGAQPRLGLAAIDLGTFTATAWGGSVTGGTINAMTTVGNLIYVGGTFTAVNGTPRERLAALHFNGSLQPFDPGADGTVYALAATNDRIFIGGTFAHTGGVAATNLGAVQPVTGAPVSPAMGASGDVYALRVVNDRLYVGGGFDTLASVARSGIGAFSALDATLDAWAPSTNGVVHAIDVLGLHVYFGGGFSAINGVARSNVAAVTVADATLHATFAPDVNQPVAALRTAFNAIFIGGAFSAVNGQPRRGGVTVTPDTGALRQWHGLFQELGTPRAFVLTTSGMWAAGSFTMLGEERVLAPGLAFFPDVLPTLAPIPNLFLQEDQPGNTTLTATDEILPPSLFGFRALSSNPALVDSSDMQFLFDSGTWKLSLTPKPDASGSATVVVTMDDGVFPVQRQFTVNVAAVNDAPVITGLGNAVMLKDTVYTKPFVVTDADTSPSLFTMSTASSNPALVPAGNISINGSMNNYVLTVTPLAGQTGSTDITVDVTDGVASAGVTFTLTVLAENTLPTISPITNQTTTMGVTVGPLTFTVGDADGGTLEVTAVSSNTSLLPPAGITLGGSGGNRTIALAPAAGQVGVTTITVTVADTLGGTATTAFQLTVNGLPPGPPQNFAASVADTQVTLTWQAPVSGGVPTNYILEGGTSPGGVNLPTTPVGLVTSYLTTLPPGTYYLRLRAANDFGLSEPSEEITVVVANSLATIPGPPTGFVTGVAAPFVVLYWLPPTTGGQATHYIVEAGSASGLSDLAVFATPTDATGLQITQVPNGVYYVRVRGANAHGVGPVSNEAVITVGGLPSCMGAPAAPLNLTPTVQGAVVTLSWVPGPGSAPAAYRIRVGDASGVVNIGEIPLNSSGTSLMATAGPGTYYLHMVASNACGTSPPSNEVSLTIGNAPPPPSPVTGLTWSLGPNNTVTLQWQPAAPGVTSYLITAGSHSGAHDLAVVPTGSTSTTFSVAGVGRGTYYVRVHATNNGGHGASNEVMVMVP